MPDQGQALVTFKGVKSWEDWDFTDVPGVAPSTGMMNVYPQYGKPALISDVVMTQDGRKVTIKNCRANAATYNRNSSGQIVSFMIFDERWKWIKGYTISGKYNTRLASNTVDPYREKTPFELVEMLFSAMEVTNYVADIVRDEPSVADARPEVDWDVSNPANELQILIDTFGLILVPRRSDGKFVVCRKGEGSELTASGRPYQDPSEGIDPQENPDALEVFGEHVRYQVRLEMEAVGREIVDPAKMPSDVPTDPLLPRPTDNADGSIKPIDQLTYRPKDDAGDGSWTKTDESMQDVDTLRVQQPDGAFHSPQDLARQTVYRMYRIKDDESGAVAIPGYIDPVSGVNTVKRKQIVLSDELVEEYIDPDGARKMKPAFCDFVGYYEGWEGEGNSLGGTRLEAQEAVVQDPTEGVTFSVAANTWTITTSKAMMRYEDGTDSGPILPAKMWLTCGVTIRHPEKWSIERFSKQTPLPGAPTLPSGTDAVFVEPIRQDDIKNWFKTSYSIDPSTGYGTPTATTDNTETCNTQADYYLDATIASRQTLNTKTLTLIGMWSEDMDGARTQVSYKITKSGADTVVSRNTEHDLRVPSYRDYTQLLGRTKLATDKAASENKAIAHRVNK